MCVNHVNMIPVYCNVVTRQSSNAGISCVKCRAVVSTEKNLDIGELWRSRHAVPLSLAPPQELPPQPHNHSPFRIWRRGNNTRAVQASEHSLFKRDGHNDDMTLLKFLAINALDLTAPASDVLLKGRQSQWFQLSGHPDSLAPAGPGTVWKKRAPAGDATERLVYEQLSADPALRDIIPRYYREVDYQGETFIELQDLLHGFQDPYVIDIKMGTRTFLESEVSKSNARNDLYKKMVSIDPKAPTEEEHEAAAVTKLRYMQFREQQSSTCSLGFRIEAMKMRGAPPVKDLKTVKSHREVLGTLAAFLAAGQGVRHRMLARLHDMRTRFEQSEYFRTREVVGSSIFMIYDDTKMGIWLIDFAKTCPVPGGKRLTHREPWVQGNHEEGFLYGLDKLIAVMEEIERPQLERCGGDTYPSTIPVNS